MSNQKIPNQKNFSMLSIRQLSTDAWALIKRKYLDTCHMVGGWFVSVVNVNVMGESLKNCLKKSGLTFFLVWKLFLESGRSLGLNEVSKVKSKFSVLIFLFFKK